MSISQVKCNIVYSTMLIDDPIHGKWKSKRENKVEIDKSTLSLVKIIFSLGIEYLPLYTLETLLDTALHPCLHVSNSDLVL